MRFYIPNHCSVIFSIVVSILFANYLLAANSLPPVEFNAGTTEGWAGGATLEWQPSGGPLGEDDSFLLITGTGGNGPGSIPATFIDGSDWIGDFSSPGITALTVDVMTPIDSNPIELRLALFGPDNTNNRWTSAEAIHVANNGLWQTYSFAISETDLVRVRGNASFEDMIVDVQRLMLRHDSGTPSAGGSSLRGSFGIDNIALLATSSLDCNGDTQISIQDLDCSNAVGTTDELLTHLMLLPGDFDGVGGVAFTDFLVLSSSFNRETNTYSEGDINGDGQVNFSDFLVLSANFGKSFSNVAAVPEPRCMNSLLVFLLAWGIGRVRKSKQSRAMYRRAVMPNRGFIFPEIS